MKFLILMTALNALCASATAQEDSSFASIIDINKDSLLVTIRDNRQAWIKQFKPNALEISELKVGDSVKISLEIDQVSGIKGKPRKYPLLPLPLSLPCCDITDIKSDPSGDHIVSAKTASGETLRFSIADTLATMVSPGYKVFTQPSHGYAMIFIGKDSANKALYGFPLLQQ